MEVKQIPWATGGGNLILLYEGEGDGQLYAASDTENRTGATRRLSVNLRTALGANVAKGPGVCRWRAAGIYRRFLGDRIRGEARVAGGGRCGARGDIEIE